MAFQAPISGVPDGVPGIVFRHSKTVFQAPFFQAFQMEFQAPFSGILDAVEKRNLHALLRRF